MAFLRLALSLVFLFTQVNAQSQCYWANGKTTTSDYVPCNDGDGFFSCCHLGDQCLAAGGCFSVSTGMTYIVGCTDSSYSDSSCGAQQCDKLTQIQGIARPCDDQGTWVCCTGQGQQGDDPQDTNSDSCPCDSNAGTAVTGSSNLPEIASLPAYPNGQIALISDGTTYSEVQVETAPVAASTTSESSATASTTPSTSFSTASARGAIQSNSSPTSNSPSPTGAAATSSSSTSSSSPSPSTASSGGSSTPNLGLVIGLPLAAVAIGVVGALAFIFLRRKRRASQDNLAPYAYSGVGGEDKSTAVWQGVSNSGSTGAGGGMGEMGGMNTAYGSGPWGASPGLSKDTSSVGGSPPTASGFSHSTTSPMLGDGGAVSELSTSQENYSRRSELSGNPSSS